MVSSADSHLWKSYCFVATEDIELQPLNGQGQADDAAATGKGESPDAIEVKVLDGKQRGTG